MAYYTMSNFSRKACYNFKGDVFSHLQKLPMHFYEKESTGKTMSTISSDLDCIEWTLEYDITNLVENTIILIGCLGCMFYLNGWLFLAVAILLPIITNIIRLRLRRMGTMVNSIQDKRMALNHILQEVLSSIQSVKANTAEEKENKRFVSMANEYLISTCNWRKRSLLLTSLAEAPNNLGTIFVLWYGSFLVLQGKMGIGSLAAFIMYMATMRGAFTSIIDRLLNIKFITICSGRIFKILDQKPEEENMQKNLLLLPKIKGVIEFDRVSFSYDQDKKTILKEVSLKINAGEAIALVGAVGTGKTTLANLILGFYKPQAGKILIDNYDINNVWLASLRRQIAIISQRDALFNASIRDNIGYGVEYASLESIQRAAKLANAHQFIEKLPQGYNTVIGENGLGLSGGERQKISIARAILKNPQIFIFDEATSYIDDASEELISNALINIIRDKTIIVISHRLPLLKLTNRALFINNGTVTELNINTVLGASNENQIYIN